MKHQSYGGERSIKMMNNIKLKDLLSSSDDQLYGEEEDHEDYHPSSGGGSLTHNHNHHVFSWPPRSYTCSFCKREFRSAQALGGHMNVHRRDRARLRQSSPPNPTPTTNTTTTPPRGINVICTGQVLAPPQLPTTTTKYSLIPNLNLDPNPTNSFITTVPHLCWGKASSTPPPPTNTNSNKRLHLDDIQEKLGINNSIKHEEEDGEEMRGMKKAEIIRLELEIGLLGEAKEDLDLELRLGSYTTT